MQNFSHSIFTPDSKSNAESKMDSMEIDIKTEWDDVESKTDFEAGKSIKKKPAESKIDSMEMDIKTEWDDVESETDIDTKDPSLLVHFETGQPSKKQLGKIKERIMRKGCTSSCRYSCHGRIKEDERKAIFNAFWKTPENHAKKWKYIATHTAVSDITKNTTAWKSRRTKSRKYFLTVHGEKVRVCKTMFLRTLAVGESCVETALRKAAEGGEIPGDMRGRHSKRRNRGKNTLKNGIREHINMFPRTKITDEKENEQEFLEEGLCVSKMYIFYKEWMEMQHIHDIATERQYRDLFNSEFKFNFFKWKKDQCDLCAEWSTATPEKKAKLQEVYDTHVTNKDAVRDLKDEEKIEAANDKTICVACFDMQKILNIPRGETSVFYYNRSLSLFNFTVFDCVQHQGYSYIWSEDIAREGPNEVASCLLKFIEKKVQEGIKDFRFYSDNYNCRNGNPYVFSMLLYTAVKYGIRITLRFLENGHFQHEGDAMRVLIEKKSKGQNIYAPEEWYAFIKHAREGSKAYLVTKITQDDILDMRGLVDYQNWTIDVEGTNILWSMVREIKVDHEFSSTLDFKYTLQENSNYMSVTNNGEELHLKSLILHKAYNSKLPIERAKLEDLLSLCKNGTIPSRYHQFYESLIAEDERNTETRIMQD